MRAVANHCKFRDLRSGDGHDELGTVLRDAAFFVFPSNHEAGGVLQEEQGRPVVVAELYEVGALQNTLVLQHAVVCDYPDLVSMESRETAYQGLAIAGLVLVEPAAINEARDDLPHVELSARIPWNNAV